METTAPTEGLKAICKKLGNQYSIRLFDLEQVIYRDFGNDYDVEVSGLNHNKKKFKANIYVWNTKNTRVVETFKNINSFEMLENTLYEITAKYSAL